MYFVCDWVNVFYGAWSQIKKKINLLMKNLHILFYVGSAKAGLLVKNW